MNRLALETPIAYQGLFVSHSKLIAMVVALPFQLAIEMMVRLLGCKIGASPKPTTRAERGQSLRRFLWWPCAQIGLRFLSCSSDCFRHTPAPKHGVSMDRMQSQYVDLNDSAPEEPESCWQGSHELGQPKLTSACSEANLGSSPVSALGVVTNRVVSSVANPVGQGAVLLDHLADLYLLVE